MLLCGLLVEKAMENVISQNALKICFVIKSNEIQYPDTVILAFLLSSSKARHYFRCLLEIQCIKVLGLQGFDHECIYAVWCG